MNNRTPSLTKIRVEYVKRGVPPYTRGRGAEFDRAIAKVRAEAKQEALREAADWLTDMASGYLRASPQLLAGRDIIAQLRARADKLVTE